MTPTEKLTAFLHTPHFHVVPFAMEHLGTVLLLTALLAGAVALFARGGEVMEYIKRYLYLFWGNHRWARKFIGGRWVKRIEPETEWVQWTESILKEHLSWPMDHREYICEDWL